MTRKGPSPRGGFISELSCSMNRANDAILALQEQDARRPSFLKDPLSSTIAQADPLSRQRSRCLCDLRVEVRRGDTPRASSRPEAKAMLNVAFSQASPRAGHPGRTCVSACLWEVPSAVARDPDFL